ncbi:type 1 glutamine amidotransferase [Lutimaribacter marinistellae]|uniref:Type 1 glutamine amidotransferase n=1 Tax=Lutimaribacter marinistellae TaxID=1820329 RepID=A0ABV7TFL0_9RHOB
MRLAIFMTNTDESAFAQRHPKDGQKFTDLVHRVRPEWQTVVFRVKDGEFPQTLDGLDGVMITGSPASVRGDAAWIGKLLDLVRTAYASGLPIFGACFGHQAVALALGGVVGDNPGGWVHGLTHSRMQSRPDWASDLPDVVRLYGSHTEQVTSLPAGAVTISQSEDCPVAGFFIGDAIYTTQHHPEMTREFITALTEELADELGSASYAAAMASLEGTADTDAFAESIARFFEHSQAT